MTLSYILPTYNKLPYLKKVLPTLVANKKQDEEIIVINDGSTDGTHEYLQELLDQGRIDQFVSKKNGGQGHSVNVGMLMAKGELLKPLTDDDVYHYDEIQKCKAFMLAHPEIDVIGSNGIDQNGEEYRREDEFMAWKNTHRPFMTIDLGIILRKSSIPIFGLADTAFVFWDSEFTVRLSAGKARLAWYTGVVWEHSFNPDSISLRSNAWTSEYQRIRHIYHYDKSFKRFVPKPARAVLRHVFPEQSFHMMKVKLHGNPRFLI